MPDPVGAAPLRYRDAVFSTYTVTSNIQYGTAPDSANNPVTLLLDLYQPTADTATARPTIVFAHGGGFSGGNKTSDQAALMAMAFAKRGYVTASIDYRLLANPGCSGGSASSTNCTNAALAAITDGETAVSWLRANAATYRIDPTRIGFSGVSAGAIMATGVGVLGAAAGGTYPSTVQGWVSISGGLPNALGVGPQTAPGFLFSGTADPTVPYQWSLDTANAMDAAGVRVVLDTLEGAGHVPFDQYGAVFDTQSANFFYRMLKVVQAQQ